jgi:hypothetical protein
VRYATAKLDNRLAAEWLITRHSAKMHIFNVDKDNAQSLCGNVIRDLSFVYRSDKQMPKCKRCLKLLRSDEK